mgnify:FL=1
MEAEMRRLKEYRREYWAEKQAISEKRASEDAARLAKIEADQRLSPRRRLEMVMAERERQIAEDVKARKAFEEMHKQQQKEEAEALNAIFARQKEEFRAAQEQAREQRHRQKEREMAALRQRTAELEEMRQEEAAYVAHMQKIRCERLRAIRELERERAQRQAEQRFKQRCEEVKDSKVKQQHRGKEHLSTLEDIVKLKGQFISDVKKRLKDGVEEARSDLAHHNEMSAKEVSQVEKEMKAKRQQLRDEAERQRKQHVSVCKDDALRTMEDLRHHREQQMAVLRQQAKEQRERGKEAIEAERREKIMERAEHIANAKELIAKRSTSGVH